MILITAFCVHEDAGAPDEARLSVSRAMSARRRKVADQALAQRVSSLDVQELFETPPSFRSRQVTALSHKQCRRALGVGTAPSPP
jgi:hypothetical protein